MGRIDLPAGSDIIVSQKAKSAAFHQRRSVSPMHLSQLLPEDFPEFTSLPAALHDLHHQNSVIGIPISAIIIVDYLFT